MRIEVLVGSEEPVVYPLKAAKVTLGTSENCDIILNAEGVSRKHITILSEGDNFYVIDQGSTNGSFINEERMIPGRKTEFTSFFPLRLGEHVLITLISDEEGNDRLMDVKYKDKQEPSISSVKQPGEVSKKTNLMSLGDMGTGKHSQKKAKPSASKGPPPKRTPQKKQVNLTPIVAFLLFGGAILYQFVLKEPEVDQATEIAKVGEVIKETKKEIKVEVKQDKLIPEADLTPLDKMASIREDVKCTTQDENYLCDYFPGAREEGFGVIQRGLTVHVMIDGTKYLEHAKVVAGDVPAGSTPEFAKSFQETLYDTALYLYLLKTKEIHSPKPKDVRAPKTPEEILAEYNKKAAENAGAAQLSSPSPAATTDTTPAATEEPPKPAYPEYERFKDLYMDIVLFTKNEKDEWVARRVLALKPEVFPELFPIMTETVLAQVRGNGSGAFGLFNSLYRTY